MAGLATAERIELALVPGQLLALGLDDLGRRLRREPLVSQQPLGTRDLFPQPLALRLDVAVRPRPVGRAHHRLEDAPLVARELDHSAAAPEDLCRLTGAFE